MDENLDSKIFDLLFEALVSNSQSNGEMNTRAIEEAGHAVMSAHLGLPFSNVNINDSQVTGEKGGSVDSLFYPNKVSEHYVRKHALINMAGAAAQRLWHSTVKENNHDRQNVLVLYLYGLNRQPSRRELCDLRKEADYIFKDEGLRDAIRNVAVILTLKRKIAATMVRRIVVRAKTSTRKQLCAEGK